MSYITLLTIIFHCDLDKAAPDAKDEANQKFQEIAFAYAILSDERRRRRYDTTGNTAESLDIDDDGFDWVDFFRDQLSSMVDGKTLDKFKDEYKGSEEERDDLLSAYESHEGDMDAVYENVMLSNVLEDDARFREIISQAIRNGEATDWPKFSKESTQNKTQRKKRARKEAEEAEQLAKELGVEDKLYGNGKSKGKGPGGKKKRAKGQQDSNDGDDDDDSGLKSLIQQRQKSRADNFFANLEAKYAGTGSKSAKGKKKRGAEDEPPEEAFQANRSKASGDNAKATTRSRSKKQRT